MHAFSDQNAFLGRLAGLLAPVSVVEPLDGIVLTQKLGFCIVFENGGHHYQE
jgi:hypothetical protein